MRDPNLTHEVHMTTTLHCYKCILHTAHTGLIYTKEKCQLWVNGWSLLLIKTFFSSVK